MRRRFWLSRRSAESTGVGVVLDVLPHLQRHLVGRDVYLSSRGFVSTDSKGWRRHVGFVGGVEARADDAEHWVVEVETTEEYEARQHEVVGGVTTGRQDADQVRFEIAQRLTSRAAERALNPSSGEHRFSTSMDDGDVWARAEPRRSFLRGHSADLIIVDDLLVDVIAEQLYGLERVPGETDVDLRSRCQLRWAERLPRDVSLVRTYIVDAVEVSPDPVCTKWLPRLLPWLGSEVAADDVELRDLDDEIMASGQQVVLVYVAERRALRMETWKEWLEAGDSRVAWSTIQGRAATPI